MTRASSPCVVLEKFLVSTFTQPIGPSAAGSAAQHAGIMNWTIDVPPQALGEKASTIDYQYKLEFDKQLSIAGIVDSKQ